MSRPSSAKSTWTKCSDSQANRIKGPWNSSSSSSHNHLPWKALSSTMKTTICSAIWSASAWVTILCRASQRRRSKIIRHRKNLRQRRQIENWRRSYTQRKCRAFKNRCTHWWWHTRMRMTLMFSKGMWISLILGILTQTKQPPYNSKWCTKTSRYNRKTKRKNRR